MITLMMMMMMIELIQFVRSQAADRRIGVSDDMR